MAQGRGDVDNTSVSAAAHERHEGMTHQECRRQVRIDEASPFVHCAIQERLAENDSGIVDENVQAAELRLHALLQFVNLGFLRNVGNKDVRLAAKLRRLFCSFCKLRFVPPNERYLRAIPSKFQRDGFAQPTACTRNKRDTIIESLHGLSSKL